jgi:hypothetical protein
MPDFTRDRVRILRCPAGDDSLGSGAQPHGVTELAQAAPAPTVSAPQNCPAGTAPTATSVTGSISLSAGPISASMGASYGTASCAPVAGTSAPSSAGSSTSLPNPGIPGFEIQRDAGGE